MHQAEKINQLTHPKLWRTLVVVRSTRVDTTQAWALQGSCISTPCFL